MWFRDRTFGAQWFVGERVKTWLFGDERFKLLKIRGGGFIPQWFRGGSYIGI